MMGYRFMAQLRCYYTVHRPFVESRDAGCSEKEEDGMQAASRRIWFSASRKRANLGGDWKGGSYDTSRREGAAEEEEEHEGAGENCALDREPGTIVGIMKPRRDFSLFSRARRNDISNDWLCDPFGWRDRT